MSPCEAMHMSVTPTLYLTYNAWQLASVAFVYIWNHVLAFWKAVNMGAIYIVPLAELSEVNDWKHMWRWIFLPKHCMVIITNDSVIISDYVRRIKPARWKLWNMSQYIHTQMCSCVYTFQANCSCQCYFYNELHANVAWLLLVHNSYLCSLFITDHNVCRNYMLKTTD